MWVRMPYAGGLALAERVSAFMPETKLPLDIVGRAAFADRNGDTFEVVHAFHPGANTLVPLRIAQRRGAALTVQDSCDLWADGIMIAPSDPGIRRLDYCVTAKLERLGLLRADAVTTNTHFLAERAVALGVPASRVAVVRDAADSATLRPQDLAASRRALGLDPRALIVGFGGFFHPDTDMVVDVVARVRRTRPVTLVLTGTVPPVVRQRLADLGMSPHTVIAGHVPRTDYETWLAACDVLLLPFSDRPLNRARWPIKLGDYLAAGRPVVAGNVGEVSRLFAAFPGIGAAVPHRVDAYADAVTRLLDDPGGRHACGATARAVAVEHLRWADSAAALEHAYTVWLADGRRHRCGPDR